ncbi:hypothetical protein [uncultured Imperialibacter sp.]|uniref:hypothetical protein n=1 Tax=uncultured Imperialibacter sp. TaxID=1672639 RepID=UPI0030D8EC7E|tara:strand:- start:5726 stop:6547 length:822 start_codon:yes stop_codon:yes gene_type:complete
MGRSFIIGLLKHGSLEVALGAVVMSMVVASTCGAYVPGSVYVSLFLAVWFIYILDRLFDARKIPTSASNPRHHFYQEHFSQLLTVLVIVGCVGLGSLVYLPAPVLLYGVLVMGSCLLYLLWVFLSTRSLPKEVVVAALYTAGISLAPRALASSGVGPVDLLIFMVIFLIAFINLILFSRQERQYDMADSQESFITRWKPEKIGLLLRAAFTMAIIGIAGFSWFSDSLLALQGLLMLMLGVLWILYQRMADFETSFTYRLIGDGIFLMPILLLI